MTEGRRNECKSMTNERVLFAQLLNKIPAMLPKFRIIGQNEFRYIIIIIYIKMVQDYVMRI